MRTETVTRDLFTFDELDAKAKDRARSWWRDCENQDDSFSECVYEDAARMAEILGIDLNTRRKGNGDYSPNIFYTGFWSQGDGACFEGTYAYAKQAHWRIREEAPTDKTLHAIADRLFAVQKANHYALTATVKHHGPYYHSYSTQIDVEDAKHDGRDLGTAEDVVVECLRDFMNWIYSQLEAAYDWTMSDEHVDDSIIANGYEFTASGEIA